MSLRIVKSLNKLLLNSKNTRTFLSFHCLLFTYLVYEWLYVCVCGGGGGGFFISRNSWESYKNAIKRTKLYTLHHIFRPAYQTGVFAGPILSPGHMFDTSELQPLCRVTHQHHPLDS